MRLSPLVLPYTKLYFPSVLRNLKRFEYIAFLDLDELIVAPGFPDLPDYIRNIEANKGKNNIESLKFSWRYFLPESGETFNER